MNLYLNNDLLGVALCQVYVPFHIELEEDPCSLQCELNFHAQQLEFLYDFPSHLWSLPSISSN